jgi:hypothetical protein
VGGGAYAFGKHRARAQEEEEQQAYDAQQQAYNAGAQDATAAPTGITSDDTARLGELGRLHDQGVLTDEEFSQQKAKILGI